MTFNSRYLGLAILLPIAACSPSSTSEPSDATTTTATEVAAQPAASASDATATDSTAAIADHAHAAWAGEWIGVEGLFLKITPGAKGKYSLEMIPDLDTKQPLKIEGSDAANGISFLRDGKTLVLRKASGDETGLKYLAGKTDCLMVQEGEGYCRR